MSEKDRQLQAVKSHFSEVVRKAEMGETTIITKHGQRRAAVLGYQRYLELTRGQASLLDALSTAPSMDDLPLERNGEVVQATRLD